MRTAIIAAAMLASAGVAQAQDTPSVSLPRGEVRALMAFCPEVGDTSAATIGNGRSGPAFVWRCSGGRAYTCMVGADGVACSSRSRSRVPLASMVDACREGDNLLVASGAYGFVWDWECREGKPVIVGPAKVWGGKSTKFDGQGYAEEEGSLLP
jgi:hypothetical protein